MNTLSMSTLEAFNTADVPIAPHKLETIDIESLPSQQRSEVVAPAVGAAVTELMQGLTLAYYDTETGHKTQ